MGNRGLMAARRDWMALSSLSFSILILCASLIAQTRAAAGPFSWGNRINFSKMEDRGAPQVDWNENDGKTDNYKGRFPRQTARFHPGGSSTSDLEMLMVMREIEKSIMESIANRAQRSQQGKQSGVPTGVRSADFRRAFTTLGRL